MSSLHLITAKSLTDDNNFYPKNDTVISLDTNGNTLSIFSDDHWDLKLYSSNPFGSSINFNLKEFEEETTLTQALKYELKLISYALFNFRLGNKGVIKVSSLVGEIYHIRYLTLLCLKFNTKISEINNNPFIINQFKDDLKLINKSTQKKRMFVIYKLVKINSFYNNHVFGFSLDVIDTIYAAVKKLPDDHQQTLVISSSIYSNFIKKGLELFKEYLQINDMVAAWFLKVAENTNYGNSGSRSRKGIEFHKTIEEHGLTEYCEKYSLKDKQEFLYHLKNLQFYSYFYFLCFTGMRATEGLFCTYNAFQKKIVNNNEVYAVQSYTTKLAGLKPKLALWVTSRNLIEANEVAQSICRIGLGFKKLPLIESKVPLFFSFYHKNTSTNNLFPDYPLAQINFVPNFEKLISNCTVTQADIDEVHKVQPSTSFTSTLVEGEIWPFKHHQFRRSLAVYCTRTGLVSLPTLKNQLKHIEVDMTAYYADGAMFAQNLSNQEEVEFDNDFSDEFNNELLEAECDHYLDDTRNQENPLFGAHGTWIELHENNKDDVEYLADRKTTLKKMKENRISYKQTPLGGCSMKGSCDKLSLAHISACVTCPNAVFNDRSIKALSALKLSLSKIIQRFDENSPYRQQTRIEINAIEKILEKTTP